jgi:biopolymer transport protein ExbD
MPKVKIPRKNISLDMTAMCDMAFLLLTFFILTTKFKPTEPVAVDIPSSTASKVIPSDSLMIISLDQEGKVYFGIDNQNQRLELINLVDEAMKLELSDAEKRTFSLMETFGIPFAELKGHLALTGDALMQQPGIPVDSSKNELISWIGLAKQVNPKLRIAIKGDRMADYKDAQKVISTLQDLNLNRMSFVTNLEAAPSSQN